MRRRRRIICKRSREKEDGELEEREIIGKDVEGELDKGKQKDER